MSANQTLLLTLPSDTLLALKIEAAQLGPEIRMLAAVKLYEMGRLSSGAASRLAGIPRTLFLQKLAEYGVFTFDLTQGEFDAETSLA